MPHTKSLPNLLSHALSAMDTVRETFLHHYGNQPDWTLKHERDPVSQVDVAIERAIRAALLSAFPDIPVAGEELEQHPQKGCRMYWTIDPIDGTVNYLQHAPLCGISIGLILDDVSVLGILDFPVLNKRYVGGKGILPSINGVPLETAAPVGTNSPDISQCVIAVGDYATGPNSVQDNQAKLCLHRLLANRAYRVRMLGSAALDLAWTASGQFGGCITLVNNSWDMAAGVAIAQASGVYVVDVDGSTYSTRSRYVIASRHLGILAELCAMVQQATQPPTLP